MTSCHFVLALSVLVMGSLSRANGRVLVPEALRVIPLMKNSNRVGERWRRVGELGEPHDSARLPMCRKNASRDPDR